MAQTYPLDVIIKKVDANTAPTSIYQRIVVIDSRTGKAVHKASWFGQYKYYLVSNSGDPRNIAKCQSPVISLSDETNRTIQLHFTYQVECIAGHEEKVAESFSEDIHPKAALDSNFEKWVHKFVGRAQAEFIENYYVRKEELIKHITSAAADLGLTLTHVTLRLNNEAEALMPFRIEFKPLSIHVKDLPEELAIEFVGNLVTNEHKKINSIAYHSMRGEFIRTVREELKAYFATSVSPEELSSSLDNLQGTIQTHLNNRLINWGKLFVSVLLSVDVSGDVPFHTAEREIPVNIHEYPTQISIKNKVQLTRQDIAKYRAKKSPDLDTWLTKALKDAIVKELFDARYIDLLLNLPNIEEGIRKRLGDEAAKIGYSLKQLITVPDLEPIVWLKKIEISDIIEEEFETRVAGVRVKLTIPIKAKLRDFTKVVEPLNNRQDVPIMMKDAIIDEVKNLIHTIHPERFYMRFDYTEVQGEKSVAKEIVELISNLLHEEFNAAVISIVPKMGRTEITDKLARLLERTKPFKVEISSLRDLGSVIFTGDFRVVAVDVNGWNRFEQQTIELEHIETHIINSIKAELATSASKYLAFKDIDAQGVISQDIRKIAQNSVCAKYGLQIELYSLNRDFTPGEKGAREVIDTVLSTRLEEIKSQIKTFSETKSVLQTQLLQAIRTGEDDEIPKIKERMAAVDEVRNSLVKELGLLSAPTFEGKLLEQGEEDTTS